MVYIVFSSCEKKVNVQPRIQYQSCSKTLLKQNGLDSTFIRVSYVDGDGDFGSLDSANVFVYDGRNDSLLMSYTIPDLNSGQQVSSQEGELIICVKSPCCMDTSGYTCQPLSVGVENNMQFALQIKDRAGHLSNTVLSQSVIIECNY